MCFSPWGKNIPWCRNVQNVLLSNMILQQGENVNFSLFSLHHRSHETGKSIEPSSWDANDFYPVNDCSVLFLNPRVHYMVITWRCWEGAAPTETNHQVAISFLIKWLLPVFFACLLKASGGNTRASAAHLFAQWTTFQRSREWFSAHGFHFAWQRFREPH